MALLSVSSLAADDVEALLSGGIERSLAAPPVQVAQGQRRPAADAAALGLVSEIDRSAASTVIAQATATGGRIAQAPGQAPAVIRSLVFVSGPEKVRAPGAEPVSDVDTSDVPILGYTRFADLVRRAVGRPVAIETLQDVVNDTVLFARSVNYPVVDVYVPEQEIRNGVVRIVVLVAKLGRIRVEGNRWFGSDDLRRKISIQQGEQIRSDTLQADLASINSNPFLSVDAVFDRGEQPGTSDIVLRVVDRFPVRLYGGYSNDGTRATDRRRWSTGVNWGDAFFLGHRLDYQFTRSVDPDRFKSHSMSYTVPLPWRDQIAFSAAYSETNVASDGLFDTRGFGRQYALRYDVVLPEFKIADGYSHSLGFGIQYKKFNNDLQFGGISVFNTAPSIEQLFLSYSFTLRDAWGSTSFIGDGFYSPGEMLTSDNSRTKFEEVRQGAHSSYAYGRIRVERLLRLPYDFSLIARGVAQWTTSNLLGSEQLPVTGYQWVRGYDEDFYLGDTGYIGTAELRLPPFGLLPLLGIDQVDQMQFLTFFDYGVGKPHQRVNPLVDDTRVAMSFGGGVRYSFNPFLTGRFDIAKTLRDNRPPQGDGGATKYHFGIVVGY